ncbi:DUF805 domain-containing protein [Acetilactobacillus jinshanensis]|uniref:DUF805 domain-containing protein n=1 Tax=Acetilactobacillus jinshanensis TaxID=1720083 RepID=A0A4P6ZKB9_9LACO|nr:DUF805 domain-containing protein [Acetilactobacillus jinshanensis]QBP18124.1 DUF805 domain-containing protein [Acetilactobacillus jinshanensis]URL60987.1 DUF805 domain-containing protein [uncultured bacterium]
MTFSKAWREFGHHLFSAKGCATRSEYNWVVIPVMLVFILLAVVGFIMLGHYALIIPGLFMIGIDIILAILIMIFGFCLLARRYHDVGSSKWNALMIFIPTLRYLDLIYMMVIPPDPERNRKYQN